MPPRTVHWGLFAAAALGLAWMLYSGPPEQQRRPVSPPPPPPPECPDCRPLPPNPPPPPDLPKGPWGPKMVTVGDPEPQIDLLAVPASLRPRNVGGTDGAGLCVFTSIQYSAHWQGERRLYRFQEQMRAEKGGGWPDKVDAMIKKYAPGVKYIQYRGKDPAILELALRTGRAPAVTWQGNHMLSLVHLDAERAAVVDNNAPGTVQWLSRTAFLGKWTQGSSGWAVVLLAPSPPPPPRNAGAPSPVAPRSRQQHNECGCPPGCSCPPDLCACRTVSIPLGGVVWSEKSIGWFDGYRVNGVACDRAGAEAELTDDTRKPHLTVIGDAEQRKTALAGLVSLAERCRVQDYAPDEWAVQCGFERGGTGPQIYLQAPSGVVLLRSPTPVPISEALRKSDPNYRPEKDPTGAPATSGKDYGGIKHEHWWCLGGAAATAAAAYALRKHAMQQQQSPPPSPAKDPLDVLGRQLVERHLAEVMRQSQTKEK